MKTTFLGQGFDVSTDKAVGTYLLKFLQSSDFHSFTGMSAFASESGIFGLGAHLRAAKERFEKLTLIVGVDQGGTSKEALEEITTLGINGYIFYQEEAPIFHPKIYLFEGDENFALIVGSSNLTRTGLFTNVESSILIEFDNDDVEGKIFLDELKKYYSSLFDLSDPNLFEINDNIISLLTEKNIIPNEIQRKANFHKNSITREGETGIKKERVAPKRSTARVPKNFSPKPRGIDKNGIKTSDTGVITEVLLSEQLTGDGFLWRSGPLTSRDLNIPKGDNTNPTGSMLFKKGELKDIDQRHYFRDTVFSDLPWANDIEENTSHLERATAFFKIVINGKFIDKFPLILTHNTRTDTKTYEQKNSMTHVSWGAAKNFIAKEELIDKVATLYKDESEPSSYILTIE